MDLDEFSVRLRGAAGALTGPEMKKVMGQLGELARQDAAVAAAADLGSDRKFKGWKTDALDVRYRHLDAGEIVVSPTPRTVGPWVVAQLGRHQGNATGFQGPGAQAGTGLTLRTKSGAVRKVRARKGRRWNGTTDPKHTFDDFVKVSSQKFDDRLLPLMVDLVYRETFGG